MSNIYIEKGKIIGSSLHVDIYVIHEDKIIKYPSCCTKRLSKTLKRHTLKEYPERIQHEFTGRVTSKPLNEVTKLMPIEAFLILEGNC